MKNASELWEIWNELSLEGKDRIRAEVIAGRFPGEAPEWMFTWDGCLRLLLEVLADEGSWLGEAAGAFQAGEWRACYEALLAHSVDQGGE